MSSELFDENVEDDDFEALFETLKTREFHDYKIHFPHESENLIDDDSSNMVPDAKIISNIHINEENTINHIVPSDIINILEEMICSIEYSFSIHFTLLHTLNNNYVETHSNESDIPIEIPKSDFSINNDDPEDFNSTLSANIDEIHLTLLPSYHSINHNSISSSYIEDNDNEEAHSFFHSRIESDIPSYTTTTSKIHLSDDINTSSLTKSITLNTNIISDSIVTSHVPIMSMSNSKNSIDDTIEVTNNNITTSSSHINYKSRRKKNREELHRYLCAIKIQSIYRRYICIREYRLLHKQQQQIKLSDDSDPAYNNDIDTSIAELKSNNDFSHTSVVLESSHISTSSISPHDPHQLMADEREETVESSNIHVPSPSLTIANTNTTTTTTTDIDSCVILDRATLLEIVENKSVYDDDDSHNDTATIITTITSEVHVVISPSVTKMLSDIKDDVDEEDEQNEEEDVEYSGIHVLNDEEEYYMYYCPISTTITTTTTTTSMMSTNHHFTPYDPYQDSIYIDSTLISNNNNNNNNNNNSKETLLSSSSTEEDISMMLMTIWRKDVARLFSTKKSTPPSSSSSSSTSSSSSYSSSGQSQSDISSALSYLFPIRSTSSSNPCTCTHSNIYYRGNQTWYNELLRILNLQSNKMNNLSTISMMSSNHPPSIATNLSKSLLQTSKDSPPPPTPALSLESIYLRQLLLQSLSTYTPSIDDINTMNRLGLDIDFLDRIDKLALCVEDLSSVTFLSICHHLIKLELNVNKLRSLQGLERLINLRYLTIKDNHLTSLEPLHSCLLLQHLEVDVNRISTIPETISLYNLITLTINHNLLSEFPKLHCPYLCHLELHHNRITTLDTLSECTLPSLQYLDVSNNNLTYVNGEILSRKCLLLHTLILSHNQLEEVPSKLYLYHLSILWLSGNRITSLRPWIPPSYMVNLDHIFFPSTTTTTNSHTVISTVSNNSMVQSITDLTHDRSRAMKEGGDSNTQSTDIHWPIYLPQLTSLHIQDNQLKTIDIGVLSTFISLKYLDLSFNKLHDNCDLYGLILGVSSTRLEKIQLYENRIYQYYHAIETCRQQSIQVSAAVEDELNGDDIRRNDNSNNMHGNDVIGMLTSNNKKGTSVPPLVVVYNELINMLRLAHPHLIEVSDYKCSPYYLSTLLSTPELYYTSDPLHLQYIYKYLKTQKMILYQNSLHYQYRYPCMTSTRYTLVLEKIQSVLLCYDYLSKTNDTNEVWSRLSTIIDTLYTHYQQLPSHIEQLQQVLESCQQKQTKEKNIMKEVWTNSHSQVEVTAENTCNYKCMLYHQDIISKYDTLLHTLPYYSTSHEVNNYCNNNNNNNNNTSNSVRKDDNSDHTLHDCITSLKNAVLLKDHHSKSSSLLQSYRTQLYFYICKVQALCRGYLTRKRIHAVFQQTKYIDPELDALFQSSGTGKGEGEGEDMNLDDFLAFTADAMINDDDSNMMNQRQYPLSSDTTHSNNIITVKGNMKTICKDNKEEEADDEEDDIYASSMNSTTFVYGDHKRVKKKNVATIHNEKEGVLAFSHTQNEVHHNNWMRDISDSINTTQQSSNTTFDKVGKTRGTTVDTALLNEDYIQHTDDSTTSSDHRPSTANSQTSALTEYTSTHVDMIKIQLDATTTPYNTTTTTSQSLTYNPNELAALLHSHQGITATGVHSQVYNHMASRETAETAETVEIEAFAQDWNIKDPKLIATLMKRNKKMKKFENAKMNREKEKDPEYRLNKFLKHTHHIASTTATTTAAATSQDMMINNDLNTTSNNASKNTITSKFAKRLGLPAWLMKPPS